jgi:hypothetical protein
MEKKSFQRITKYRISTWRRVNLGPYLTPGTSIYSKLTVYKNARVKAIKVLEENVKLSELVNDLLDMTPSTQVIKD